MNTASGNDNFTSMDLIPLNFECNAALNATISCSPPQNEETGQQLWGSLQNTLRHFFRTKTCRHQTNSHIAKQQATASYWIQASTYVWLSSTSIELVAEMCRCILRCSVIAPNKFFPTSLASPNQILSLHNCPSNLLSLLACVPLQNALVSKLQQVSVALPAYTSQTVLCQWSLIRRVA